MVPGTPADAKGLLTSCIDDDDPCVFIEPSMLLYVSGPVPAGYSPVPLGQANVRRVGTDVTVISWGWPLRPVLAAAEELEGEGVSVEVLDLRTLVPFDRDAILASVAKTGRALVVHAATQFAGPGAGVGGHDSVRVVGPAAGTGAAAGGTLFTGAVCGRAGGRLLPGPITYRGRDQSAGLSLGYAAAHSEGQSGHGRRNHRGVDGARRGQLSRGR